MKRRERKVVSVSLIGNQLSHTKCVTVFADMIYSCQEMRQQSFDDPVEPVSVNTCLSEHECMLRVAAHSDCDEAMPEACQSIAHRAHIHWILFCYRGFYFTRILQREVLMPLLYFIADGMSLMSEVVRGWAKQSISFRIHKFFKLVCVKMTQCKKQNELKW